MTFDNKGLRKDQVAILQPALFPDLTEGLGYRPELFTPEKERELIQEFAKLDFRLFQFHGHEGNRRVVSFGRRYDFACRDLLSADPIPAFLLPLRGLAAHFAGLASSDLQHVLLTEYAPGAGIGWHRDRNVFGDVIGISFLSACTFRFRRATETGWKRKALQLEPRSAYLLRGEARTVWEHSIPPGDALRYSVTFRSLSTA